MELAKQLDSSYSTYSRIIGSIGLVIKGQDNALRKLMAAFLTGHHVLLEDMPGTGKTTLAKALAASVACDFQRVQFTPDLLPSDIIGVSIYNQQTKAFNFHRGPIFTQILLADEINRASPRTQSALLEAMAEKQISIDGSRYELNDVFFVIATQNPVESHGTYPLPEAQLDRFGMRFSLGYVSVEQEMQMLADQGQSHPLAKLTPCATPDDIMQMRDAIKAIHVSDEVKRYIVSIVADTRAAKGINIGASFRATMALMQTAQALALFDAQEFVAPEQVQEIVIDVLAHRLTLDPQSRFDGRDSVTIINEIISNITPPV